MSDLAVASAAAAPALGITINPDAIGSVVNPGGKKKEKKRKRVESSQSAASIEPPRKQTAPPTAPRKRIGAQSVLPPTPQNPSTSERGHGRSPHTPDSPLVNIHPIHLPKNPSKTYLKHSRFPSARSSHSAPVSLSSRRIQATPHPSSSTYPSSSSSSSTKPLNPNANKDRTIRELRQKLAKRELDLANATKRLAAIDGQKGSSSSSSSTASFYSATSGSHLGGATQLDLGAESTTSAQLEAMLGVVRGEKFDLEQSLGSMKEAGRAQSTRLAEAEIKARTLAQQLQTAIERGKKWVARSGEFEAQLGANKKELETQRKRAEEAEGQVQVYSADATLVGNPLRQNLLAAKAALASERLITQDLRGQLAQSMSDLAGRDETIVARDLAGRDETIVARDQTIAALSAVATQSAVDLAESQARVTALDRECESQLDELKALLDTVMRLCTDVETVGQDRALFQQLCSECHVRISELEAGLAVAYDRAEWYKAEYAKKEGEAVWWKGEAERIREVADARPKRIVKIYRGKARATPPTYNYTPQWGFVPLGQRDPGYWERDQAREQEVQVEPLPQVPLLDAAAEISFDEKLEIAMKAAAALAEIWVKAEVQEPQEAMPMVRRHGRALSVIAEEEEEEEVLEPSE